MTRISELLDKALRGSVSLLDDYFTTKSSSSNKTAAFEYSSPLSIALKLRDALKNGEPFSLIRLGDGESSIFQYPEFCSNHRMQYVISRAIDGDFFKEKKLTIFKKHLLDAIKGSDVVGIYDSSHPSIIARIYSEHIAEVQFKKSARFCDPRIHFYLQQSGHLESLVHMSDRVTLITGRNVLDKFKSVFPQLQVSQILLPSERSFRLSHESDRGVHYPDCFEKIREEMEGGKGHLILVGAGFLGKTYCEWARQRGAVAIDIGSVFDYWDETPTREGYLTVKNGSLSLDRPPFRPSMSLGAMPIGERASANTNSGAANIIKSPNNFVEYFSHSHLKSALIDLKIKKSGRIKKDKYRVIAAIYVWINFFKITNIHCVEEQGLSVYMPDQYSLKKIAKISICGPALINEKDCGILVGLTFQDADKHQLDALVEILKLKPSKVFFCDFRIYDLIKEKICPHDYTEYDLKLHTANAYGSAGFLISN